MKNNYSASVSSENVVNLTPKQEMRYYDKLPPDLRLLLQQMPVSYSAKGISDLLEDPFLDETDVIRKVFQELEDKFPNYTPI